MSLISNVEVGYPFSTALIIAIPTSCKVNDFDGNKTGKIQIKGLKNHFTFS